MFSSIKKSQIQYIDFPPECLYFLHNIPINLFPVVNKHLLSKEEVLAVVLYRKTQQENRRDSSRVHMQ